MNTHFLRTPLSAAAALSLSLAGANAALVTEMEYFVDADPGQGNGVSIPVVDTEEASASFELSAALLESMTDGMHMVGCRAMDEEGDWSTSERVFFLLYTPPENLGTGEIAGGEYFIDTDPGVGNGVAIALSGIQDASTVVTIPPGTLSALDSGFHLLGVRARNAENDWSAAERFGFFLFDPVERVGLPVISRIEYRWFKAGAPISPVAYLSPDVAATVVSFEEFLPLDGFEEAGDYQLVFTPFDELGVRGAAEAIPVVISPMALDTDGDGLPDFYELANTNPASNIALDPQSDDDGNGFPALLDFAMAKTAETDGRAETPFEILPDGPGRYFLFTYLRPRNALDHVTYRVRSSTDLGTADSWSTENDVRVSLLNDETEKVTVKSAASLEEKPTQFFQLEVIPK